jgi:hypothetical protein
MSFVSDLLTNMETRTLLSNTIEKWRRVHILVVTDTIVSFGPEQDPRNLQEQYFGMSHLIGVLEKVGEVTRAHRSTDPLTAPNVLPNFRFHQHDLSRYHQIWLLGYDTGVLPVEEQKAIAIFMNNGGGVFATGDHEGLGSALAGTLPRVRSMRRWDSPPPAIGSDRIDTTRPDVNNVTVFENQSDDIPQVLSLKGYGWSQHKYYREGYPHPLLCSRTGPITEFPDHMHEGEVVEPDRLDAQLSLDGLTFDEYPKNAAGKRVGPEVIAWGFTRPGRVPAVMSDVHIGDPGNSALSRWTGTIGAYDGHQAGVGRVVVHSTWHHFFDINLIGDNAANRPGVVDPRKVLWSKGFTASVDGLRILGQIDQYYCNIVRWLSPGLSVTWFDALVADLATSHHMQEIMGSKAFTADQLGAYAWEYALRHFPPCTLIDLTYKPIEEAIEIPWGPWDNPDPVPGPDDAPLPPWPVPPKLLAQAALGGGLLGFSRIESIEEIHSERGLGRVRIGARDSVSRLLKTEQARAEAAVKKFKDLSQRLTASQR